MTKKPRYVVTLYNRCHSHSGVYGPFYDEEAAEAFGRSSGASRFRVSLCLNPVKFLFDARQQPSEGGRSNNP